LALAFSSSFLIAVTQAAALAASASAVLLLATLLALRAARKVRERRSAVRTAAWREALHVAIYAPQEVQLPPVEPALLPDFLQLWNHLRESLRGEAGENLATLIHRHGMLAPIRALSRDGTLGQRLSAITTLGHLRDREWWDILLALTNEGDAVLSFAAARALFRIDPARALDLLLAQAARREDWPLSRLGATLQEVGPDLLTAAIVRLLTSPPDEGLERLLKLAKFAHREQVAGAVRGWLGKSSDPNVIGAAIDFIEDARDRLWVRTAAQHPSWRVRMAAARALGRIGVTSDQVLLLDLLRDQSWWVRYRAAQALASLPGICRGDIETLRARTTDKFAADILTQVLAEGRR
jgi:hypothetical protein